MKINDIPVEFEVNGAAVRGGVAAIETTPLSAQPTEHEDAHRTIASMPFAYGSDPFFSSSVATFTLPQGV